MSMQLMEKYISKDEENNSENTIEINLNLECINVNNEFKFGNANLVNVGTITAELFNPNLLNAGHMFQYVFKTILTKGENGIEGIYEYLGTYNLKVNIQKLFDASIIVRIKLLIETGVMRLKEYQYNRRTVCCSSKLKEDVRFDDFDYRMVQVLHII